MILISIQDGDTFTVMTRPTTEIYARLRLADIDAPERGEALFREAREHLGTLLRAGPLDITYTNRQEIRPDPCNRWVVYGWVHARLIQADMIAAGLAVVWAPRGWNQHTAELVEIEGAARRAAVGIWRYPTHRLYDVYNRPRTGR